MLTPIMYLSIVGRIAFGDPRISTPKGDSVGGETELRATTSAWCGIPLVRAYNLPRAHALVGGVAHAKNKMEKKRQS